jgi:hypothetical protein
LINPYPPANTFGEPAATEVQPEIASPILPTPLPFAKTVVDPVVIAAEWEGQGAPGSKCDVLLSSCRLTPMPFINTSEDFPCLVIPEQ